MGRKKIESPRPYGIVYCVSNTINSKVYIGATTASLAYRWRKHRQAARLGSHFLLQQAIRELGVRFFSVRIIDSGSSKEELFEKEISYILKFNSRDPNGYNATDGGRGPRGFKLSEETRSQVSKALTGHCYRTKESYQESSRREKICKRGHVRTKANTYINPNTGKRQCMVCFYLGQTGKVPKRYLEVLNYGS